MMKLRCMVLFVGMALPTLASAADVYKWVDENGNVHFGDRPPQGQSEQIQVRPDKPNVESQQRVQRLIESQEARQERRQQEEQAHQEQAAQHAAAERQASYCKQLRKNLETLKIGGRVYEARANGERHYFSSEEMAAEIQRLESSLAERCQ